ncbi:MULTISPECIES: hypothetical protein [unclassified Paenibacillus]|uniref:hypothetical protein n=1 Tax=unclassified Paenibacillus TaxID=185978 RepID=UPI003639CD25
MTVHKLQRSTLWFIALTFLILAADLTVVRTSSINEKDWLLVYAVMFDCMLVIPFLYWLCMLRGKGKSISKVLPLPLLGGLAAWLVLPVSMRNHIWNGIWPIELLIIAVEVTFIAYEVRILYRFFRCFRQVAREEANTGEALRKAVHETIGRGKLASLLLHDVSAAYYLLFSWKRKTLAKLEHSVEFSYYRKTSQRLYAAILSKILIIEGICVHFLVQQWSDWAAWILSISDFWLLALIWSDYRASVLQPVKLQDGILKLRYGLRIQADVPLQLIAHTATALEYQLEKEEQRDAALPLLAAPNIRIELKEPITVEGLLFLPRKVTKIFLALDEPETFVREIEKQTDSYLG